MALKKEEEKQLLTKAKEKKEGLSEDKFKSWVRGILMPGGHSDKFEKELDALIKEE